VDGGALLIDMARIDNQITISAYDEMVKRGGISNISGGGAPYQSAKKRIVNAYMLLR